MDRPTTSGDPDAMAHIVEDRPHRASEERRTGRTPATALFWRLFLFNALVFVAAAVVLVISPATVSAPVSVTEAAVLTIGSALMLVVNGLLLRANLRPLDGLTALMERVDLLRPGDRLPVRGDRDVANVIGTFNDMLDRLEHERGMSTAHALAAQEGERQRIARELHDEVGQSLTAVLLGLKRVVDRSPAELRDELQVVQEMVRASLDEVKTVARRLRPGVLEDLGLVSALQALASDFVSVSDIRVVPVLDPQLPALSKDEELVLYRIAQEGLTNIARHASASRVDLVVSQRPDGSLLSITDDGRGLGGSAEGAGIRGMRERALLIGAELTLGPAPDGGTVLRLFVPSEREGNGSWNRR